MAKQLQITIADPCHENWENMTPDEKGRFCGSCQKQVIDFSEMSDRQIAEFFKKPILSLSKGGSVCGRFMTDQLDRAIAIPKKRIPWVRYFFQVALPAFLVTIKASAQKTQSTIKVATKDTARKGGAFADTRITLGQTSFIKMKEDEKNKVCRTDSSAGFDYELTGFTQVDSRAPFSNKDEIWGKVITVSGEAIPFASIEITAARKVFVADQYGVFRINRNCLGDQNKVLVSSTGYETDTVQVGRNDYLSAEMVIQLKNDNITLQDVVVSTPARQYKLGGATFSGITVTYSKPTLPQTAKENGLVVYPNPVRSGEMLQLDFKWSENGYYQVQLLNQSGQLIKQQVLLVEDAALLSFDIPQVAAGAYILAVTSKRSGNKFSEKIIIQ